MVDLFLVPETGPGLGIYGAPQPEEFLGQTTMGNKRKQGLPLGSSLRLGAKSMSKAASLANLMGNFIIRKEHVFPEQQRKINMDKKLAAEQLALQSLQFNTKHMNEQLNAQLELNRLFSRYDSPTMNSRLVNETFRKDTTIHGKELGEAHLVIYTPSADQMKYLKEYVEEFGVGCDIPDVEHSFFSGMVPGIIRYRNLEDHGIRGIRNLTIREYIKTRLMTGVKVVEIAKGDPDEGCLTVGQFRQLLSRAKVKFDEEHDEIQEGIDRAVAVIEDASKDFKDFNLNS